MVFELLFRFVFLRGPRILGSGFRFGVIWIAVLYFSSKPCIFKFSAAVVDVVDHEHGAFCAVWAAYCVVGCCLTLFWSWSPKPEITGALNPKPKTSTRNFRALVKTPRTQRPDGGPQVYDDDPSLLPGTPPGGRVWGVGVGLRR